MLICIQCKFYWYFLIEKMATKKLNKKNHCYKKHYNNICVNFEKRSFY